MARVAEFTVTDAYARRRCLGPNIRAVAQRVRDDAAAGAHSGTVAAGFAIGQGRDAGTWLIVNPQKLARYHEYGTVRNPPFPALGRAMARTGLPRWSRGSR